MPVLISPLTVGRFRLINSILDEQATSTSANPNSASNISGAASNNSSSNANNQILLTSSSSGARSFVCTDCKLGFRTHGVLAKHLRSKNHVKTLSSLGKLPEDALNLIKENSIVLASIDATDSESAYESLFRKFLEGRSILTPTF